MNYSNHLFSSFKFSAFSSKGRIQSITVIFRIKFQIFLVFLSGTLKQDRVVAKSYHRLTKVDADRHVASDTTDLEPSQLTNETINTRTKRHVVYSLSEDLCSGFYNIYRPGKTTHNTCVQRWYYCPKYNIAAVECKSYSYGCLCSILKYKQPLCKTIFKIARRTIDSREIDIKFAESCECM